jgi:hypothetical protein
VAKSALKTVKSENFGKSNFRLVLQDDRFFGLIDGKITVEGDQLDETWHALLEGIDPSGRRYFSMPGARRLFLYHYPNGFGSSSYAEHGERGYKEKAKLNLDQKAPAEEALESKGLAEPILSAFNATDLLSPYEKMWTKEALVGKDADDFIRAAADFTLGENRSGALRSMERALKGHGAAKWTIVTYLPFLWRPKKHMFLKPDATMDFAERTGHRFAKIYSPALDIRTYESLLDLAEWTAKEIDDLEPHDNIDIQSFIWVVSGSYAGEAPRP